ncbi:MAG: histidine phosphatase family protein [Candidatus Cloacimonetes bacterium]|nr:histidine phosphatase family protein [Candidatus Cloacimonadota bacterium]
MNHCCKLVIVRHGETTWNIERRWQGHADSELSKAGLKQATLIAKVFPEYACEAIYSSDLQRAARTARIIGRECNIEPILDNRLRERNLGILQGHTIEQLHEKYPDVHAEFIKRNPDYVIPEGESTREKHHRCINFIETIARRHRKVAIITHGGVLDSCFRHTFDLPLDIVRSWSLLNAAIHEFEVVNSNWKLLSWGQISHLGDMPVLDGKIKV